MHGNIIISWCIAEPVLFCPLSVSLSPFFRRIIVLCTSASGRRSKFAAWIAGTTIEAVIFAVQ